MWPAATEWIDRAAQAQLVGAYVRRKRFEARLIAIEVGRLFAGADASSQRVSAGELLGMAGISL